MKGFTLEEKERGLVWDADVAVFGMVAGLAGLRRKFDPAISSLTRRESRRPIQRALCGIHHLQRAGEDELVALWI